MFALRLSLRAFASPITTAARLSGAGLLSILIASHASANPLEDIRNLVQAGKAPRALAEIRALPAQLATSMEAALLEAEALSAQGKHTKAEILLYELIERMPSRPEPYNNLAVILARQGDIQGAQEALEKGMNANPAYAALYRNLTQIYVDKARNAYSKALQLGESRRQSPLNPLLAMASQTTFTPSSRASSRPAAPVSHAATADVAPATPVPATSPDPEPTSPAIESPARIKAPANKPAAPQRIAPTAAPTAVVAATEQRLSKVEDARTPMNLATMELDTSYKGPEAKSPADTGTSTPSAPLTNAQLAVKTVLDWAEAWSRQSPKGYLAAYSSRFTPPKGATREAWQALRQQRILNPEWIKVELGEFKVTIINDDQLNIDFRQHYQSNRFNSTVRKRMVLVRENDSNWRILSERVTSREIVH